MAYKYIYVYLVNSIFIKKQLPLFDNTLALYQLVFTETPELYSARLKFLSIKYKTKILVTAIALTPYYFFLKPFSIFISESNYLLLILFNACSI